MAPPFAEQPVFVLLDEVGGKFFKGDGTVAGEAEKTVQCTGVYAGGAIASGLPYASYQ